MTWKHLPAFILLLSLQSGCARTIYTNLHPGLAEDPGTTQADRTTPMSWRHFFIYGWVPGELTIDAEAYCGSTTKIDRIETRQTFAQGLVTAFAGYYINIYAPYSGAVICDHHADRR